MSDPAEHRPRRTPDQHSASGVPAPGVPRRTGPRRHLRRVLGTDHNPLCRRWDRLRSAIVLAAAVLLLGSLAAAWPAALTVLHHAHAVAAHERAHRRLVAAVVVGSPETAFADSGSSTVTALAAWTYPAGRRHRGWVDVAPSATTGSTVATWVDGSGRLTGGPASPGAVVTESALAGLGAWATATGAVLLLARAALLLDDRLAARAWAAEWSRVEPGWSRQRPSR